MTPTALALVLTAAVAHAVWNLAARGVDADGGLFVLSYAVASAVLWLPVTGLWLATHRFHAGWTWLLASVVSGLLHTAYGVVLQRGYREGDLGVVYPVARGVGPLTTLVVSVAALGQRPPLLGVAGALVILAGVVVISLPTAATRLRRPPRVGVAWGAATGLAIAAYTLWDSHAVTALDVPPLPYFTLSVVFQALPLLPRAVRRPSGLRAVWIDHRRAVLTVGALSPLAYVLVLQAMRTTPVALVACTRETSIVVGALLGWWVLHEPGGVRRVAGAVVVLGGIALVALA